MDALSLVTAPHFCSSLKLNEEVSTLRYDLRLLSRDLEVSRSVNWDPNRRDVIRVDHSLRWVWRPNSFEVPGLQVLLYRCD